MKRRIAIAFMASLLFLTGCASPYWHTSTYDQFPLNRGRAKSGKALIKVIAIVPGGGVLADALGIEFAKRGFVMIPSASTVDMATGVDFKAISEHHIPARRAGEEMWKLRHALRARNVDAFMIVQADRFVPKQHHGDMFWQQANLQIHGTTEEGSTSSGAIADSVFFNGRKDRPSSPPEAAASMVRGLATITSI